MGFDGSGSGDSDGSVASYAWDFGDGSSGSGVAPGHVYAEAGSYPVRLTVTDDAGATGSVTHTVTVAAPPPPSSSSVGFVGAAHSGSGARGREVATVPAGARAGDTALLFLTRNASKSWGAPSGVTGWRQVDSATSGSVTSTVWVKTLTAADAGAVVRVDATSYTKATLTVAVYSGVEASAITAGSVAHAADSATRSHTSASVTAAAGAWGLTYWGDKSQASTAWTAPAGATQRSASTGTGYGRFASLLTDTAGALPAGSYGGLTASTDATSTTDISWTIPLTPSGSPADPPSGNVAPVAGFSSRVEGLSVGFDGSGSGDSDGSVASYAWDFGDGSSGSGVAPGHVYAEAGSYPVRLTVTDDAGATGSVTHTVTVAAPPPPSSSSVGFVGAAHSGSGARGREVATVPAGARAGDTALLFLTRNASKSWGAPSGVTGWRQVDSATSGSVTSTVWVKTLTAADAGAVVRVDATSYTKATLTVAVYSGVEASAITAGSVAHAADSATRSHTSASVTAAAGAWGLTYWGDKSQASTAWTAPAGATQRSASTGTGYGRFASLLTDTAGALPAGSYGGLTASTDATSTTDISWTIPLTPTP